MMSENPSSKTKDLSKLERRLIDNYERLKAIARLRKECHRMYDEDMENGTTNYYIITEMLIDLEKQIWNEIDGVTDEKK